MNEKKKENYEVEHTLDFGNNNRRLRDIVPKKSGGML